MSPIGGLPSWQLRDLATIAERARAHARTQACAEALRALAEELTREAEAREVVEPPPVVT